MELALQLLLSYLIGCVMGGRVIGALRGGVDLRRLGSGNIGATNALRTQGAAFALGVLLIDVLKGVVAVLVVPQLALPLDAGAWNGTQASRAYACGAAVVIGHCYPLFNRFVGGKGVATLAGVVACLLPQAALWMLAGFVLVVMLSGYVSLATLCAAVLGLFQVSCVGPQGLLSPAGLFLLGMNGLLFWKHRHNLLRLYQGTESRFERARVLGRWLRR